MNNSLCPRCLFNDKIDKALCYKCIKELEIMEEEIEERISRIEALLSDTAEN